MVMWKHYKCDHCGKIIYVDAGDVRLCERCLEALRGGDDKNEKREEPGKYNRCASC